MVGLPAYHKMKMKAQQSEVKAVLSTMYMAQKTFYGEWTQYYGDFRAVGFQIDGDLTYHFGFAEGGVKGPSTHPSSLYKGKAPAVKDTKKFCGISKTCTVLKAKTTKLVAGTTAKLKTYKFGGASNLDPDVTLDEWTIDEQKQFSQVVDDISL